MIAQQWIQIFFLFALGACVGSFLNVVVWRVPRNESLISPGSHCPNCNTPLAWYDNLPVIGWIKLAGKCRYCRKPISARYPIVEAITGCLFVFYYVMFFIAQRGPTQTQQLVFPDGSMVMGVQQRPLTFIDDWPIYMLYMYLVASLLAASLIDAELFIIPVGIPWLMAIVGIVGHTLIDNGSMPGALTLSAAGRTLAAGGAGGLALSMVLWAVGWIPQSFAEGEPLLDVDRATLTEEELKQLPPALSRKQITAELGKELMFLALPVIGAIGFWLVTVQWPAIGKQWTSISFNHWVSGFLGAAFGAMIGAAVVWVTRILGTLAFGRIAMGLGDVHLMFGVGAIIGAGGEHGRVLHRPVLWHPRCWLLPARPHAPGTSLRPLSQYGGWRGHDILRPDRRLPDAWHSRHGRHDSAVERRLISAVDLGG